MGSGVVFLVLLDGPHDLLEGIVHGMQRMGPKDPVSHILSHIVV